MYAVKITGIIKGMAFVSFAGLRGERKSRLEKIEGWKLESSARKYIAEQKNFDKVYQSKAIKIYEIIKF